MPGMEIGLQKLIDQTMLLQAELFNAEKTLDVADLDELKFIGWMGALALNVDAAILGLDDQPKEFTELGRERAMLILESYRKGYKKYAHTLDLYEDDVKELDAKLPGWRLKMQGWPSGWAKFKAMNAGAVISNADTLLCWDGQYLADADHPSFYQGGDPQSNLLQYKFGRYALWEAIQKFQQLKDPFSGAPAYNKATHVLYAPNIEREALVEMLAAIIAATSNVMYIKKITPVLWRTFADDQFAIVDASGPKRPILGVYDAGVNVGPDAMAAFEPAAGPGLSWSQSILEWFEKRKISIGTFGKVGLHPGAWDTLMFSDGTNYHEKDAPPSQG